MRQWLLAILLVAVMTYAYTHHDDIILEFSDAIPEFSDAGYPLIGEVVLVVDGDTFYLKSRQMKHYVNLVGIDAPELDQAFGDHSKHFLMDMVESQTVIVQVRGRDKYGIILGELFVNQLSINELMLTYGYAWAIRGFRADRKLQGMEKLAQVQGLGLWRDKDATPPWEYRKQLFDQ